MAIEEAGEDPLAEEAHQERGVPFRQGEEAAGRGAGANAGAPRWRRPAVDGRSAEAASKQSSWRKELSSYEPTAGSKARPFMSMRFSSRASLAHSRISSQE